MGNDKIAAALGLTVNSAKVMVNELIREGYLLKSTDTHDRRVLNLSGKPYLTISCVDLSNIDKRNDGLTVAPAATKTSCGIEVIIKF